MLTRTAAVWAAVSGLVGTCMLGISFAINPGPPAGASGAQLAAFGQQHYDAIAWGAWLQAVGPVLIVMFALAIVVLAGVVTLIDLAVPAAVQVSASVPALWSLAAAGTVIRRARHAPSAAGLPGGVAVAGHGTAGHLR